MTIVVYPFKNLHSKLSNYEVPAVLHEKLVFGNRNQIDALKWLEYIVEGKEISRAQADWEVRQYEVYR